MTSEFTDAGGLIAPSAWPYRSHALGLCGVEEHARLADQLADTVGEVAQDIRSRWSGVLPDVYEAPGAEHLYLAMDPAHRAGETVSERLRWGAKLMRNYTDTVGGLKQRLATLETEATAWRATVSPGIWVSAEDLPFVRVAEFTPAGALLEALSPLAQAKGMTLSWREHRPSVEQNQAYVATISGLTEQIRDAIETLVHGLQTVEAAEGRISALTFAMGGSPFGSAPPDDGEWFMRDRDELEAMTPEQLTQWWNGLESWQQEAMGDTIPLLDLDRQIVEGKLTDAIEQAAESESGTDIAALDATLQVFGQDEAALAAVIAGAGGAAVATVVHAAGQSAFTTGCDMEAARRVATRLREGLSTASADWEPEQAQKFALEMLRGVEGGRHASAVGFLFGDHRNSPMGEEFTVATATELDAMERDPIGWQQPWLHIGPEVGVLALEALTPGQDGNSTRLQDPMGRVLSTLGEYPDAALNWLTDDGTDEYSPTDESDSGYKSAGQARLEYYFQERDSSVRAGRDGFEGVAALWSGAQEATGGPLDPNSYDPTSGAYDPEVWEKVATMTTYAVRGLSENETFIPEQVSTLGMIELASGTVDAMPHLAHNPIHEYSTDQELKSLALEGFLPSELPGLEGEPRATPNVTRAALAEVAAAAASSPASVEMLTQGVSQYQEVLVGVAQKGQTDPREAVDRIVKLEAFLSGARDGGEAGVMNRKDEAAEQAINAASTAAGAIPVPEPVEKVGKLALKGAVAWATDEALDAWTNNLAEAQVDSEGKAREEAAATGHAAAELATQLGVDGLSANEASGTFDSVYEAIYSKSSDGIVTQ